MLSSRCWRSGSLGPSGQPANQCAVGIEWSYIQVFLNPPPKKKNTGFIHAYRSVGCWHWMIPYSGVSPPKKYRIHTDQSLQGCWSSMFSAPMWLQLDWLAVGDRAFKYNFIFSPRYYRIQKWQWIGRLHSILYAVNQHVFFSYYIYTTWSIDCPSSVILFPSRVFCKLISDSYVTVNKWS